MLKIFIYLWYFYKREIEKQKGGKWFDLIKGKVGLKIIFSEYFVFCFKNLYQ